MPESIAQPALAAAQFKKFALAVAALALVFAVPLWRLLTFSLGDDLHSYIPLMPFVCGYLAWVCKEKIPAVSPPARGWAGLFLAAGAAAVAGYWLAARSAAPGTVENSLALGTLAWLLFLTGAGCLILGGARMRSLAFPFFLLIFMVPFPTAMREAVVAALQQGSATVADWLFTCTGTPFWRQGMLFGLPGITLEVAPECSGIHSTLVLLITSLVAGHLILRRPWKRWVLCLAVIPLALLRNGFRVFVLGQLCIHIGPRMINSPIHHRGGPIFFVLSLVPFFLLLYVLRRGEITGGAQPAPPSEK